MIQLGKIWLHVTALRTTKRPLVIFFDHCPKPRIRGRVRKTIIYERIVNQAKFFLEKTLYSFRFIWFRFLAYIESPSTRIFFNRKVRCFFYVPPVRFVFPARHHRASASTWPYNLLFLILGGEIVGLELLAPSETQINTGVLVKSKSRPLRDLRLSGLFGKYWKTN